MKQFSHIVSKKKTTDQNLNLYEKDFNLLNKDEFIPEQPQQYIYTPQPLGLGTDQSIPPESWQESGPSSPSTTTSPWNLWEPSSHIPTPSSVDEEPLYDDSTPTLSSPRTVFSPPCPNVKRVGLDTSRKSSLSDRHQHKCYDLDSSIAGRILLDDPLPQRSLEPPSPPRPPTLRV